jgi:hypothetical protein
MTSSDFTIHVIDIEERKRRIAHALWEQEGRPEGRAEIHWQEACRIVEAELKDPEWLKRAAAEGEIRSATPGAESAETKRGRKVA